jgi:hypothetical protein
VSNRRRASGHRAHVPGDRGVPRPPSDHDELTALDRGGTACSVATASATPAAWLRIWYRHYQPRSGIYVVTVWRATSRGRGAVRSQSRRPARRLQPAGVRRHRATTATAVRTRSSPVARASLIISCLVATNPSNPAAPARRQPAARPARRPRRRGEPWRRVANASCASPTSTIRGNGAGPPQRVAHPLPPDQACRWSSPATPRHAALDTRDFLAAVGAGRGQAVKMPGEAFTATSPRRRPGWARVAAHCGWPHPGGHHRPRAGDRALATPPASTDFRRYRPGCSTCDMLAGALAEGAGTTCGGDFLQGPMGHDVAPPGRSPSCPRATGPASFAARRLVMAPARCPPAMSGPPRAPPAARRRPASAGAPRPGTGRWRPPSHAESASSSARTAPVARPAVAALARQRVPVPWGWSADNGSTDATCPGRGLARPDARAGGRRLAPGGINHARTAAPLRPGDLLLFCDADGGVPVGGGPFAGPRRPGHGRRTVDATSLNGLGGAACTSGSSLHGPVSGGWRRLGL